MTDFLYRFSTFLSGFLAELSHSVIAMSIFGIMLVGALVLLFFDFFKVRY